MDLKIKENSINRLGTSNELQNNGYVEVMDSSTWSLTEMSKASVDSEKDINLEKTEELYSYQSDEYPSDDVILLERLRRMGYFTGEHHLEEIMYLENIRRSKLLQILDKFRDVLITCENEDPAMALFYSQPAS